jgi:hypothetical protein
MVNVSIKKYYIIMDIIYLFIYIRTKSDGPHHVQDDIN